MWIDNKIAPTPACTTTPIPPETLTVPGELRRASLVATNWGSVLITATSTLGSDVRIADSNSTIELDGHTLMVGTFQDYNSSRVTKGTYTDNTSGWFDGVTFNDGTIAVSPPAGLILVR